MAGYVELRGRNNGLIKAWIEGVPVEPEAIVQLKRTVGLPFIYRHLAVMPDVHVGMGATIGSVIATDGAVVPAAVGVDLGCGMQAVRTKLTREDILRDGVEHIAARIEAVIPHGRTNNGGEGDRGAWHNVPDVVASAWMNYLASEHAGIAGRDEKLCTGREEKQLGTLGTGNHFIEVSIDEEERVWVVLHSGSRGIGNRIGTYFIRKAKEEMQRLEVSLPDRDLAYLEEDDREGSLFQRYRRAAAWAQRYARTNRDLMMDAALEALFDHDPENYDDVIDCHHNYIDREEHFGREVWLTRKGATRARVGDRGIIPGAMGRISYIVRGKGNPDSFASCSHGAGRLMSRTEAKRTFTVEQHIEATKGVHCRKDAGVLDETPEAYKDINAVMDAQADLVEIEHVLEPMVCVKG